METKGLVYTIRDRCRVCYTCVRECPVKAIKIVNGQAEVIPERCIACGNCTIVCSQGAKVFVKNHEEVLSLLEQQGRVAALIAPSFAAEFDELEDYRILVGMLRKLGFSLVLEVAFGADLVTDRYLKLLYANPGRTYISSDCPAIVNYIEHYRPEVIEHLIPVVSPMVATTRAARKLYGKDLRVVFIGPCIAKKEESAETDLVITFRELRQMLKMRGIDPEQTIPSDFDPPVGGKGAIFPVSRGMMHSMNLSENVFEENVLVASGRGNFQEAIKELVSGSVVPKHMELLCCEGCIMGPGMSRGAQKFAGASKISRYVKEKLENLDQQDWQKSIRQFDDLDLSRTFVSRPVGEFVPSEEEIEQVLQRMGKFSPQDYLDCGACGYDTCRNHAIAIINGLAENEMCLPYTIEKLHKSIHDLAVSRDKLFNVQQALKQTEKLAHMGQLSAGIAHELNNPLGVIIMYSNILLEECPPDSPLRKDLELIVEQSARCKSIVSGLLNFARKNQVNHAKVDLNEFIELAVKSVIIPPHIRLHRLFNLKNKHACFDQEQMTQVITNLLKNAVEAMPSGGEITLLTEDSDSSITFVISDTGTGIQKEYLDKVFEPFFTTKGIGKGTGLGLATAYGIVKMHKGQITVTSNADPAAGPTGTTFRITLPREDEFAEKTLNA